MLALAEEVTPLKPGVYEAYSKYNTVYFIESSGPLTKELKDRLRGAGSYHVEGRQVLAPGTRVQVNAVEVYAQNEKRAGIIRSDEEKDYYGPSTQQRWKYGAAQIRVLDGKMQGRSGWMLYGLMQLAGSDGKKPAQNHYTSYLRPVGSGD